MGEWAEELAKAGLPTPEEIAVRVARWEPPALHDEYPFPIRSDTGLRDLRQPDMVLGDRPGKRGAKADQIPVSPGTAYVVVDAGCSDCGLAPAFKITWVSDTTWFDKLACELHLFREIAECLEQASGAKVTKIKAVDA